MPGRFSKAQAKGSCPTRVKASDSDAHSTFVSFISRASDAILAIAWSLRVWGGAAHSGVIIFDERAAGEHCAKGDGTQGRDQKFDGDGVSGAGRREGAAVPHVRGRVVCGSEVEAIGELQRLVEEVDPDVVCGFDIQRGSIGYILDRCAHIRCSIAAIIVAFAAAVIVTSCPCSASPAVAAAAAGTPCFPSLLSRLKGAASGVNHGRDECVIYLPLSPCCESHCNNPCRYGRDHSSDVHVVGRIVLNVWRLLRKELKLPTYTQHMCCLQVHSPRHHRACRSRAPRRCCSVELLSFPPTSWRGG